MKRAFYNPFYTNSKDLSMASCGHEILSADFVNHLNLKFRHIIHYVMSGQLLYEARGKALTVNTGDAFIIYPGEQITYRPIGGKAEVCWIVFSGQRTGNVLASASISENTLILPEISCAFMQNIIECLEYTEASADRISQLRLNAYILNCLSATENNISARNPKRHITEAVSFMECNYATGINISDVANQLNLERTYFYKIFKNETGKSPSRFLTDLRISKAKILIRENLSFKNIASAVGLKDVYYFSTLFKKTVGITPGEYKKIIRENGDVPV